MELWFYSRIDSFYVLDKIANSYDKLWKSNHFVTKEKIIGDTLMLLLFMLSIVQSLIIAKVCFSSKILQNRFNSGIGPVDVIRNQNRINSLQNRNQSVEAHSLRSSNQTRLDTHPLIKKHIPLASEKTPTSQRPERAYTSLVPTSFFVPSFGEL